MVALSFQKIQDSLVFSIFSTPTSAFLKGSWGGLGLIQVSTDLAKPPTQDYYSATAVPSWLSWRKMTVMVFYSCNSIRNSMFRQLSKALFLRKMDTIFKIPVTHLSLKVLLQGETSLEKRRIQFVRLLCIDILGVMIKSFLDLLAFSLSVLHVPFPSGNPSCCFAPSEFIKIAKNLEGVS